LDTLLGEPFLFGQETAAVASLYSLNLISFVAQPGARKKG